MKVMNLMKDVWVTTLQRRLIYFSFQTYSWCEFWEY